jgi:hypothetical protein
VLESPIKIDLIRPLDAPKTPYGRCEKCQYVSTDLVSKQVCPVCNANSQQGYTHWPDPELEELWFDEVEMWNQQRVEIAVVTAAMYFEASVFHLIYWATCWLDPDLHWLGCSFEEFPEKQRKIWSFLCTIKSPRETDKALKRLFKATGQEILKKVLGEDDADFFWEDYRKLSEYRNEVVHKGRRALYRVGDGSSVIVHESNAEKILDWCLRFIPICWNVFSKIHNEFIHKTMWKRKQEKEDNV